MARTPRYIPDYQIRINGQDLPRALRSSITSVRYQDGRNAADRVEIQVANSNLRWLQTHIRGLGFQPFPTAVAVGPLGRLDAAPDGLFDIDNTVSLAMGYTTDPLEDMFLGEITGVQASFPSGGMPTMTLVAHDYLNRLSRGSYGRGFGPLTDAVVA